MRRALLIVALAASALLVPVGSASAHGVCSLNISKPITSTVLGRMFVGGHTEFSCEHEHYSYNLHVLLQRRLNAQHSWVTIDELNKVTIGGFVIKVDVAAECSLAVKTWQYHTRTVRADVITSAGTVTHVKAPPIKDSSIAFTDRYCTNTSKTEWT